MRLIGYVCPEDQENYQVLYSSQLYGTFFSVYVRFNCKTTAVDHYVLKSIDFKLINYKGLLDIGIVNINGPWEYEEELNHPELKLFNIEVRALSGNENYTLPCENLVVNRGDYIYTQRTLTRLHDGGNAHANKIFDEEFYYREGLSDGGQFQRKTPAPETKIGPIDSTKIKLFSGTQCPTSINKVI